MPPHSQTRARRADLLGSRSEQWLSEPTIAFQSWLGEQSVIAERNLPFQETSQVVYTAMWNHFVAEVFSSDLALTQVTSDFILEFLNGLTANHEHRLRYRLLLIRVFDYLTSIGVSTTNPARHVVSVDFKADMNRPMPFLSEIQRTDLIDAIQMHTELGDPTQQRDAALTSLLLGAGLKLGEALACSVNCIDIVGGWVTLTSTKSATRLHRSPIMAELQPPIARWLRANAGPTLFPSPRVSAKGGPLDAASAFRGVARICATVPSVTSSTLRVSPQTLRNSYIAWLIELGHGPELIAEYMGFVKLFSARRVTQAYELWKSSAPGPTSRQPAPGQLLLV